MTLHNWQTPKHGDPQHVFLSPLCHHERHGWINYHLFLWLIRSTVKYAKEYGMKLSLEPAFNFHPAAAARNCVGRAFIEHTNAEWILMIDNDIRPPDNLLDMIVHAQAHMDILVPVMQMWDNKRNNVYLCWKPEAAFDQHTGEFIYDDRVQWIPLTACGSGAIAIRRRVLESLPYPWFQYEYSTDFQLITSEDVYFTARAKAAHFSIFGYTKALTGHYHTVDLSAISPKIEPITPEPESPKLTLAPLVPKNNSPQKP